MLEALLRQTAERFWESASHIRGQFPRDIESAIAWSVPLVLIRVPNLWVHNVAHYLRRWQSKAMIDNVDRQLHGCVIAMYGKGFIFIDGTDGTCEIRFTIAHEVAHFLLDYQQPRLRAVEKFGIGIEEVLNGRRSPRPEERIDGLLANTPICLYTHFMHRDATGFASSAILEAESQADRLAFELVAPEGEIWQSLPKTVVRRTYPSQGMTVRRLLTRRFGLPSEVAREYAAKLCRSRFGGPSVREWLGIM